MNAKLKLGLISLSVIGVTAGIVLSWLYIQPIQGPEITDKGIPEKYRNPFYCDEVVGCGVGTIQGDPLRSECVNEYHARENAVGPYCECLDNKCVSTPAWISTNDPNDQFSKGEEIIFTFAIGISPIYGSRDRWTIYKLIDSQWKKMFENDYNLSCSTIDKDYKAFWTTDSSGKYKIKLTFFTDPICKSVKTTEREFKVVE